MNKRTSNNIDKDNINTTTMDSRIDWSHIERFQDVNFAHASMSIALPYIVKNYSKNNPIVILGVCAGNGIVEYALGLALYRMGYNISIISTDVDIRNSIYEKHVNFPYAFRIFDVLDPNITRKEFLTVHQNEFGGKKPQLLIISRAWHHYFTKRGEIRARENIMSLLKSGEMFVDIVSSGTKKYLNIQEKIHNLVKKKYKHHTIESYIDLNDKLLNKHKTYIKFIGIGTRYPRTFNSDFIKRYLEIYKENKNIIDIPNDVATKQFFNDVIDIVNKSNYKPLEINSRDLILKLSNLQDPGSIKITKNNRIQTKENDEVVLVKDSYGSISDIVLNYSYPVFIYTQP